MDLKNSLVYGFAGLDGRVVPDLKGAENVATEITSKAMRGLKRKLQKKNLKKDKKSP